MGANLFFTMDYKETIEFLFSSLPVFEQTGAGAYKPGLERVGEFAALLGDPQKRFRSIHIAGTNGKGSTSHMLAAVLQQAGFRVGLFTSPHLVDFRERIRVDGQMVDRQTVVDFTERWRGEMERLQLSFFEMAVLMAFDCFARQKVDVAVVETGLGGRLDATNIIVPELSVITNIGLEHTQYLGDTIAAIAGEKAGIIKPGVPVVIGETDPESAPVFRARAAESGSEIVFADGGGQTEISGNEIRPLTGASRVLTCECGGSGVDVYEAGKAVSEPGGEGEETTLSASCGKEHLSLDLKGDYQRKNVRTVLAAIEILRRRLRPAAEYATSTATYSDMPHSEMATMVDRKFGTGESELSGCGSSGAKNAIADSAIRSGLAHAAMLTGLAGRWQIVGHAPLTVCDTAHNAHGLAAVVRQIERQKFDSLFMVLGFAGDKDMDAIMPLLPRGARFVLTRAANGRAMPAEELAGYFSARGLDHEVAGSVAAAVGRAKELAGAKDMIYIGGSNFVVGEFLATVCRTCSAAVES